VPAPPPVHVEQAVPAPPPVHVERAVPATPPAHVEKPGHAPPTPRPKHEHAARDSAPAREDVAAPDHPGRGHEKHEHGASAPPATTPAPTRGRDKHDRRPVVAAATTEATAESTNEPAPANPVPFAHGRKPDTHRGHGRKDPVATAPTPVPADPTATTPVDATTAPVTEPSEKEHDRSRAGAVDPTQTDAAPADPASPEHGKGHDKQPASEQPGPTPAVDFSASPT